MQTIGDIATPTHAPPPLAAPTRGGLRFARTGPGTYLTIVGELGCSSTIWVKAGDDQDECPNLAVGGMIVAAGGFGNA